MNKLILGDNLEILRQMDTESVDLIYLDPPFFSERTYEIIWGDADEMRSFKDRWSGGISHYIDWLKDRVIEMHRVLKSTGALFLHCDWHANAYIRVEILDKLFGEMNFRNEIIWKRTTAHNHAKQGAKRFGHLHDTIFFYTKSFRQFKFNVLYQRYPTVYRLSTYHRKDENGRPFKATDLSAAKGGGDTSFEWKGVMPPKNRFWAYSKENFEQFEADNLLYYSKSGKPYLKQYWEDMPGKILDDMWEDMLIPRTERVGYITQKPIALLERIINCATQKGDIVLDPFVGGGTTVVAAQQLNRQWIGIDQSVQALKITELRLGQINYSFKNTFFMHLEKYDYDTLRYKDPFDFEDFIILQFGGIPNTQQHHDSGIDGRTIDNLPIQVKRSESVGRNVVDNFHSAMQRYDKRLYDRQKAQNNIAGYIIAFSFGKGAIEEVARLKNTQQLIIKLLRVDEIVMIVKNPTLTVESTYLGLDKKTGLHEFRFKAIGSSPMGVQFYSWDFDYKADNGVFKPSVVMDKKGFQKHSFNTGQYQVGVKVIDANGLEKLEIIPVICEHIGT
jgi:DNA modification methylase